MPLELHRDLTLRPADKILWRYMDFAKFVHLLERQALWFSRVDQFEDPLEGACTDAEIEYLRSLDEGDTAPASRMSDGYLRGPKYMRTTAYASCWRAADGESMAMWDLYSKGGGIIAVKTTVEQFKLALSESHLRVFLGRVNYIAWSLASWNTNGLTMCFRKDPSYEHEHEVRAVVWDPDRIGENVSDALKAARERSDYPNPNSDPFVLGKEDGQCGIEVPFSVARFVTDVVGPREGRWFATLVEKVLRRYGVSINPTISNRLTPR